MSSLLQTEEKLTIVRCNQVSVLRLELIQVGCYSKDLLVILPH